MPVKYTRPRYLSGSNSGSTMAAPTVKTREAKALAMKNSGATKVSYLIWLNQSSATDTPKSAAKKSGET